ncbi:MAG: glycosyltransferase family 2 protein [Niastella sp.]|nr:glycosyltransferase family 2 protein [Niastella sp.]
MISILIPVYNQDVNNLVARLSAGLSHLQGSGEIIVMDDGSTQEFRLINETVAKLPFVRYMPLEKNQGRARIRQLLAEAAAGEWLLFIDGDSEIPSDNFLADYYQATTTNVGVIVGGRIYTANPPQDCNTALHWKYGTYRESRQPGKKHQPAFMTNNFMIQARYFKQLTFDTGGEGYGHEDTWIGIQLEQCNIPVSYIDNPVLHAGLETNKVFITKSENALVNLQKLSSNVPDELLVRHVKLFRVYRRLAKWQTRWVPAAIYKLMKGYIHRNLQSCNPSLRLFDLYRLQYFIQLNNRK